MTKEIKIKVKKKIKQSWFLFRKHNIEKVYRQKNNFKKIQPGKWKKKSSSRRKLLKKERT